MAYSKKVVEKFENTLNNPEAFKVGLIQKNQMLERVWLERLLVEM
jgi:hypothetical protein